MYGAANRYGELMQIEQPDPMVTPLNAQNVTAATGSAALLIPGTAREDRVTKIDVTEDCYLKLGGSDVTVDSSTGVFFFAGTYLLRTGSYTHLSAVRVSTDGLLYLGGIS